LGPSHAGVARLHGRAQPAHGLRRVSAACCTCAPRFVRFWPSRLTGCPARRAGHGRRPAGGAAAQPAHEASGGAQPRTRTKTCLHPMQRRRC
jgi:hypothetical protein